MEKIWYISQIDLFEGIPDGEIMRIAAKAEDRRCSAATQLYTPYDGHDRNVFILKEGEVLLYHSVDGKKNIFDVIGPGSIFGNFLPDTEDSSHYAEALPQSRVCVLSPEDFQRVISVYPDVLTRLLNKLALRLQDYEQRLRLDMGGAKEKVLGELQRYQQKKRNPFFAFMGNSAFFLTHEKIAELTGLNRVTVTRALKLLKLQGEIDIDDQGRIVLLKK